MDEPAVSSSPRGRASITVSVPGSGAAAQDNMNETQGEERKNATGNSDIQNMLDDFEMDLGIEREDLDDDDEDAETDTRLAMEVNLLKQ